jgi:hypothetical protein
VPLATWFRFRRAVENTNTALLVFEQEPYAKSCASLAVFLQQSAISIQQSAKPSHARLLREMEIGMEVVRSSTERKAMMSARAGFKATA